MVLNIKNSTARKLWLNAQGLALAPIGPVDLLKTICDLGFVQLDTINNVTRAHHHILWSRNQNYREPMLNKLLAQDRSVFEHFTHDASVLPMQFYPMWQRQFKRMKDKIDRGKYYKDRPNEKGLAQLCAKIEKQGPLSTKAFDSKISGKKKMWSRPPHKQGLDYLWYCGVLATSHRHNFNKYYDLRENVVPDHIAAQKPDDHQQVDWLCNAALQRLGFATPREIQQFWDATDKNEVANWLKDNQPKIQPVQIQSAGGEYFEAFAPSDIVELIETANKPTSRLRIINPFDPAIRDRARLKNLFGFSYKIEIFVPAAKRKWGYYVYPLLEGTKFVGRIELTADRKTGQLLVKNFWQEPNTNWPASRKEKLTAELTRFAKMAGLDGVRWDAVKL